MLIVIHGGLTTGIRLVGSSYSYGHKGATNSLLTMLNFAGSGGVFRVKDFNVFSMPKT